MTLDKYSWGYRRNAFITEILTINKLIQEMVEAVSCGGKTLKEGTFSVFIDKYFILKR